MRATSLMRALLQSPTNNGRKQPKVQALMGIKASLKDPHAVLDNWDEDAVDPCSWTMFTCSAESLVMNCIFEQGEAKLLD
nr:protein NSP-INTERACTING KINASE 1-like isoform X2 [Ipomoea batatas]GMD41916.1 protein NSP-INTERACTING KINASE 1-like isoform X2 [Ipomoea batatas]